MARYTQTILMPLPRQHLRDVEANLYGRGGRRMDNKRRTNEDVNSILTFFD